MIKQDVLQALDALGNYIIKGDKYGYATDQNGLTEVNIGYVKNVTPKGLVTLDVFQTTNQYTSNGNRNSLVASSIKQVSVKPIKLFKIN